jgi:FAD/FMN-containing dehydrogenase
MLDSNVVGFDTASQSWSTEGTTESVTPIPLLDGRLFIDSESLRTVADDFGHLRQLFPSAVLEPRSNEDIVNIVNFARECGITVVPRGGGYTSFGQAQAEGGIVIKMSTLHAPPVFGEDWVEVSAGMTWRQVLMATLERGLQPPVLTHNTVVSVGGTLSVGGIDGGSYRHGAQVDNVLELEVVTGAGRLETCSASHLPELFDAVLAGLGQCAIILRARLKLIPAKTHTLMLQLFYRDLPTMLSDQRSLVIDGRFDRISSYIFPMPSGTWKLITQAGCNFTPPALPDKDALCVGLHHIRGFERATVFPFFDRADLGSHHIADLIASGRINIPHPWFNAFLPDSAIDEFATEILAALNPSEMEPDFPIEFFPFDTRRCKRPLFRLPNEPFAFLFNLLNTIPDPDKAKRMLDQNLKLFERVRELGGKCYPIGAIQLTRTDWQNHYDPYWNMFASAKDRFDPDCVLVPGPGIF